MRDVSGAARGDSGAACDVRGAARHVSEAMRDVCGPARHVSGAACDVSRAARDVSEPCVTSLELGAAGVSSTC